MERDSQTTLDTGAVVGHSATFPLRAPTKRARDPNFMLHLEIRNHQTRDHGGSDDNEAQGAWPPVSSGGVSNHANEEGCYRAR